MSVKAFVDSNIWLYAFMDVTEPKHTLANVLLSQSDITLSPQVVNEICHNLIRKAAYTEDEIRTTIQNLQANYLILDVTLTAIQQASILRETYRFSHWDSLIIATAQSAGCATIYSEDMQHGLRVGELTIVTPFKT